MAFFNGDSDLHHWFSLSVLLHLIFIGNIYFILLLNVLFLVRFNGVISKKFRMTIRFETDCVIEITYLQLGCLLFVGN